MENKKTDGELIELTEGQPDELLSDTAFETDDRCDAIGHYDLKEIFVNFCNCILESTLIIRCLDTSAKICYNKKYNHA